MTGGQSSATATATAIPIQPEIHHIPPVTGFTTIGGITVNPSVIMLSLAIATVIFILWKGQREGGRNSFDIWDLVMDTLPDGTRRASGIKCAFQGGFILSSWVIIDQEIKSTLNEAVYGLYLATWCASLIAKVVFDKKDPPSLPGTQPKHQEHQEC